MKRIVSLWFPNFALDRLKRQVRKVSPGRGLKFVEETLAFALVVKDNQALKIAAANRAARRGGVYAGMALADAFALLPMLQTRPAQPGRDGAVLKRLAHWCTAFAPWTTVDGRDGLLLDITGTGGVFGGEAVLLEILVGRLRGAGFATRFGVAPTVGAAWALARFAGVQTEIDAEEGCAVADVVPIFHGAHDALPHALGPLPVEALRLDAGDARVLRRLGLKTIGDVANLPRASVTRRFAKPALAESVLTRLDQLFAGAGEPISPLAPAQVFQARRVFAEPLVAEAVFPIHVQALLDDLCRDLAAADQGARAVRLVACRSDASTRAIVIKTARATADAPHLARLLVHHLERLDPGFGIDAFVLTATRTEPLAAQQGDLKKAAGGGAEASDVTRLIDRLQNRLGAENVIALHAAAHHIPEWSEARVPARWPPRLCDDASQNQSGVPPRPLHLFHPPQPIDVVTGGAHAQPKQFRWRSVAHHLVRVAGPERILPEWWREIKAVPLARDYYDVEDSDGHRFWIFKAYDAPGAHGPVVSEDVSENEVTSSHTSRSRWHMHGVFP